MGDLVGNAPEQEALRARHPLVADDDQVRPLLLRDVEDRIGGVALAREGADLDPAPAEPLGSLPERGLDVLARVDHVLEVVSAYEPVPQDRLREEAQQVPGDIAYGVGPREDVNVYLEAAAGQAKEAGVAANSHPREGDPADSILDVAEETGADLIVVGNKGMTGARRFLLGSVPNKISHHAPCGVFIVRTT